MKKNYKKFFILFFCFLFFCSCVTIDIISLFKIFNPTKFDTKSYSQFVDLKIKVISLYKTFSYKRLDKKRILKISDQLNQVYEYERGKGHLNLYSIKKIKKIRSLIVKQINHRIKSKRPWTKKQRKKNIKKISYLFNILIQSENVKRTFTF